MVASTAAMPSLATLLAATIPKLEYAARWCTMEHSFSGMFEYSEYDSAKDPYND